MRRKEGHVPPLTPLSRAVNMRSVHTDGSTQAHRARIGRSRLRSRLQGRQYHRGASVVINVSHPLSCIPSLHAHYRRFSTTMDALTPARVSLPVQVSVLHAHGQVVTIPSPTTRCSVVAPLAHYPSGPRLARHASDTSLCWRGWRCLLRRRARLRTFLAVSPKHQAETSSSSYGLVTRQRLLSTPPHGDAVTVGYRPENVCLDRSRTCQTVCARTRTRMASPDAD